MTHSRRSIAVPVSRSHMSTVPTPTPFFSQVSQVDSGTPTENKVSANTQNMELRPPAQTVVASSITVHPATNRKTSVVSTKVNEKPLRRPKPSEPNKNQIILDSDSPKLDVHSNIRLFPHQQSLVAKMLDMETSPRKENTFVGVLPDPPGTGKSFPLLALMLYEKRQLGRTQNLLVIPHNIHKQWVDYIARFSGELNAKSLMYYGDITALFYDARALFEYDILITTSTFYDMVTSTVRQIGAWFNRVVMDEIDSIAFSTMMEIPSQAVWLVSASAEQTKIGAYAQYAKQNAVSCDPLFIKRSINLPPPLVDHHTCFNEFVPILQSGILTSEQLKWVYAVDFTAFKFEYLRNEDVINTPKKLLSAKFRDDCLNLHSTLDSMKALEKGAEYQAYLPQFLAKKVEQKEELQKNIAKVLNMTGRQKCAMCCNDFAQKITQPQPQPYTTEEKLVSNAPIAADTLNSPTVSNTSLVDKPRGKTRCCKTLFCLPCLEEWITKNPRCPKCNESIESVGDDVDIDTERVEPVLEKSILQDKMESFYSILKKESQRDNFRILIFSDMSGSFIKVQDILKQEKLPFAEIEGNQYTMDKAMIDYKSGKRPILLVDSGSYGAGMNMEMTTAVIIMHKTEREAQIIGRAQRLGRTDRLHVHHLLYPNE